MADIYNINIGTINDDGKGVVINTNGGRSGNQKKNAPTTHPPWLTHAEIEQAVNITLQYKADRGLLLTSIPASLIHRLEIKTSPFTQIQADVTTLNGKAHVPGENELPIWLWLRELRAHVSPFIERDHIEELMRVVKYRESVSS